MMKKESLLLFMSCLFCLFISACSAHPSRQAIAAGNEMKTLREDLRENHQLLPMGKETAFSVGRDLLPDIPLPQPQLAKHEHRFDIHVQNAPARAFFASLVKGTPYSVAVSPEIQGNITLDLKRVTVLEALEAVRDVYGYEFQVTTYGFRVTVPTMQTRVYHINYLAVHRYGRSETSINPGIKSTDNSTNSGSSSNSGTSSNSSSSSGGIGSSSDVVTTSDSDFWNELRTTLTSMIGKEGGHSVIVNTQSGIVMVSALPNELRQIEKYLISSQLIMNRQVILEAKILEVTLNAGYESGVNWTLLGLSQLGDGSQMINDNLKPFTSIFTLQASGDANFTFVLNALQTQGKVKVLSSPRISTVNNQKALIKVGADQYFVTNVTSNTANSVGSLNTTQNVDLNPFFSGIALDVTPQIDRQGSITLHVHPVVSQVSADNISFTLNGQAQSIPSARTTIRESDNIIHARDGQVVVLGGLMQNTISTQKGFTPILGKVPVVGPLFQNNQKSSGKTELIILLRPIVVKNNEWNDDIRRSLNDFREMNYDSYDYRVKAPPSNELYEDN